MVQLLNPMLLKYAKYLNYLNYLKFTTGKCCHFFCEWFFFRFVRKWHNTIKICCMSGMSLCPLYCVKDII